jgi:hypothetical protein
MTLRKAQGHYHRGLAGICLSAVLFGVVLLNQPQPAGAQQGYIQYLPYLTNNKPSSYSTSSKWVGIYMQQYWTDKTVDSDMSRADSLAGKKHAVSAWFIDIHDANPSYNMKTQLEALWKKGYISFINLNSNATAYAIASGQQDNEINKLAQAYKEWAALGGGRRAYLAPLPEMNGVNADGSIWATYGGDAANYKLAYQRIRSIFAQKGVTSDQVWWVFVPNGWSADGHEFERYYPGDSTVDVIGFSSYNYGFCKVSGQWKRWENFDSLYEPYLTRFFKMAPAKPIVVAQTGTTAEYEREGEYHVTAKNSWLKVNYEYLAGKPQVMGVLYYDYDLSAYECNWKITSGGSFSGYGEGISAPPFTYLSFLEMEQLIP